MVGYKFLILFFLLHKAAGTGGNTTRSGTSLIKVGSTVKMEDYPRTGDRPLGFSIDVFMYVMSSLSMDFEWEVYPRGDGHNYYDRLVQQAADEVYDVIVADVTITANRSEIVEFSHPFAVSDVVMVVVAEREIGTNNPWWFLWPMSLPLWVATLGIILLKGVLIFIFERGVDKKYGGDTLSQQMRRILSLSFTTFISADCSGLKSFYSMIVSILWAFLVLIVAACYTANLASTLTVEQLLPRARDLQTVIDANEWIGYHSGSFVEGLLASRGAKRLRSYSADDYEKALRDGSVVAIVDEMPQIRSSLRLHPNFAVVERIHRTGGLGFVFPKNSSLVSRVSQQLLKLRESGVMCMIERKWFRSDSCSRTKRDPSLFNSQLTLRCFRWLYTFIVLASGVILFVFLIFTRKCEVVPSNPGDHEND